jgi:hypothetical protein
LAPDSRARILSRLLSHRRLDYEENDDPIGTTDLATFVLCFLPFFAAFFAAFLSAFFAIFRNLLCLTTIRASV